MTPAVTWTWCCQLLDRVQTHSPSHHFLRMSCTALSRTLLLLVLMKPMPSARGKKTGLFLSPPRTSHARISSSSRGSFDRAAGGTRRKRYEVTQTTARRQEVRLSAGSPALERSYESVAATSNAAEMVWVASEMTAVIRAWGFAGVRKVVNCSKGQYEHAP